MQVARAKHSAVFWRGIWIVKPRQDTTGEGLYWTPLGSRDTRRASGCSRLAAAAAKLLQSCPTLCDPVDGSPPGSPVPGILQARSLERVAISFSNAWSEKWKWGREKKVKSLSHVQLFATPWTAAYQAPPSMGFSRQKYWVSPKEII